MNFSLPNLIGGFIFGTFGFAAWRYGKGAQEWRPMVMGMALMIFPYFIDNVWLLYGIGIFLTASLFFFRDPG